MPARIVVNPVVTSGGVRRPLCATLTDPGRTVFDDELGATVQRAYVHVSAISDGAPGQRNGRCLSIVGGVDFGPLDAAGAVTLFEADSDRPLAGLRAFLLLSPADLGWNGQRVNRLRDRLAAEGADTSGLSRSTPLWQVCNALGQLFAPGWDVRNAGTTGA